MNRNIVNISNLNKSFTQGREKLDILTDVNLNVEKGNIVSMVGESGCGKSTLLQIIGGLLKYDSGEVEVAGLNLKKAKDQKRTLLRRHKIGFIYQQHHLLADFTALENIEVACKIAGYDDAYANKKGLELLDKLELSHRASHRPSELSGGQQQRVAIARAFANNPELVLADEPTGNLDEKNSTVVMDLFMDICKNDGCALVIATHNKDISKKTNVIYQITSGHLKVV